MEEKYKGFIIRIEQDMDPEDPREWDNLGTMVCFHRNYSLGDKNHGVNSDHFSGWNDMAEYLIREKKAYMILPLRLYDHSNISMSTGSEYPFNCRWDSGQVGFIYVTKEKIKKEYGVKRIMKKIKEKAEKALNGEVNTYSDYISGSAYAYAIEETGDSCTGYYGTDGIAQAMADAKGEVDSIIKDRTEQHTNKVKAYIKNNVPLEKRKELVLV